tara:strand:- start:249 stop:521 length:273 start_codon:yes stop_codon:yes gene_type:complete
MEVNWMKDQKSVDDTESKVDKYNRAVDIFIESVQKPDTTLRSCAHNQKCYNELMDVREQVLNYVYTLRKKDNSLSITQVYYDMEHDSEGC